MRRIVTIIFVVSLLVGLYFAIFRTSSTTERVTYPSHTGTVSQQVSLPLTSANKTAGPNVAHEVTCSPRQLMEVVGALDGDLKRFPSFVVAEFIIVRPGKEPVTANSAIGEVLVADDRDKGGSYRVLINAPPKPGKYLMRIRWGENGLEAERRFDVK